MQAGHVAAQAGQPAGPQPGPGRRPPSRHQSRPAAGKARIQKPQGGGRGPVPPRRPGRGGPPHPGGGATGGVPAPGHGDPRRPPRRRRDRSSARRGRQRWPEVRRSSVRSSTEGLAGPRRRLPVTGRPVAGRARPAPGAPPPARSRCRPGCPRPAGRPRPRPRRRLGHRLLDPAHPDQVAHLVLGEGPVPPGHHGRRRGRPRRRGGGPARRRTDAISSSSSSRGMPLVAEPAHRGPDQLVARPGQVRPLPAEVGAPSDQGRPAVDGRGAGHQKAGPASAAPRSAPSGARGSPPPPRRSRWC